MPLVDHTSYETTIVCSTPGCGHYVSERTNHIAIDDSRMREDLDRRGWICWTKRNAEGWRFAIDLCPDCATHPQAKNLVNSPPPGRFAPRPTLPPIQ